MIGDELSFWAYFPQGIWWKAVAEALLFFLMSRVIFDRSRG